VDAPGQLQLVTVIRFLAPADVAGQVDIVNAFGVARAA
jgi:hypothetical protein